MENNMQKNDKLPDKRCVEKDLQAFDYCTVL